MSTATDLNDAEQVDMQREAEIDDTQLRSTSDPMFVDKTKPDATSERVPEVEAELSSGTTTTGAEGHPC